MESISLKLSAGLGQRLARAAKQRGQSKSEVVRAALEQFLQNDRPLSALDLAGDLAGAGKGPGDLSTNPKHLEGFGR